MENKYGISIKWLAVSSFEIRCGDTTIVTDPFITECERTDCTWENVENCDIITLSHAHWDHITDIPRLAKEFKPKILCGEMTAMPLATWLNYNPTFIYPMSPNLEVDFGGVKIRALFGRHGNFGKDFGDLIDYLSQNKFCQADPEIASLQNIGSMEYRNYLFTFPNGTTLLIWGSEPNEEQYRLMQELKCDIAIIQRSKSKEGMKTKARFAQALGCKVLIPHHHDFHKEETHDPIEFLQEEYLRLVPDGVFVDPKHGEWVHL